MDIAHTRCFIQKLRMLEKIGPVKDAAKEALKSDPTAFYELMTAPTTKILDKWFESEPLKVSNMFVAFLRTKLAWNIFDNVEATLATDACIGAMISPNMPGSGYVLLHHVMGELGRVAVLLSSLKCHRKGADFRKRYDTIYQQHCT